MASAITENIYTSDGGQTAYNFTFEYIETTDVNVTLKAPGFENVEEVTTAWSFNNATTIELDEPAPFGHQIRIFRKTDNQDVTAEFFPGSSIRSQDLNDDFKQILFISQETTTEADRAGEGAVNAEISAARAEISASNAESSAADAVEESRGARATADSAVTVANSAEQRSISAEQLSGSAVSLADMAFAKANAAEIASNEANTKATEAAESVGLAQTAAEEAAADLVTAQQTIEVYTTGFNSQFLTFSNQQEAKLDEGLAEIDETAQAVRLEVAANTTQVNDSAAKVDQMEVTVNETVQKADDAVSTANSAATNAGTALTQSQAAINAVAGSLLYDLVATVSDIPDQNLEANDAVKVIDSTGIENFSPLAGLPDGFEGDSGLYVELIYDLDNETWNYSAYNANDPDARYSEATDVRVDELQQQVETNTSDIAAISTTSTSNSELLATHVDTLARHETELDNLNDGFGPLQTQVNSHTTDIAQNTTRIDDLESNGVNSAQIAALQAKDAEIEEDVADNKEALDSQQQQIFTAEQEIDSNTLGVQTLMGMFAGLLTTDATQTSDIAGLKTRADAVEADVDALETDVAALQDEDHMPKAGGNFTGRVTQTEKNMSLLGEWDMSLGNYWTVESDRTIYQPINLVPGTGGLIKALGAISGWQGEIFKFANGEAPAPAVFPAVMPYYVASEAEVLIGPATELA